MISVPIYDSCTLINTYYGKSALIAGNLTQYLCTDSECRNCTTSSAVKPWSFNKECEAVIDSTGSVISRVKSQVISSIQNNTPAPTDETSSNGISAWYFIIPAIVVGAAFLCLISYCGLKKFKPGKVIRGEEAKLSEEQSGVMLLQLESVLREFPTDVDDID
ncbi:hypothetical protein HDV01_000752 [Terramyces sp. JEL0728]|nr:hypothetical protein HDV01_000752 [Terramyces sp. JEL0728]